MHSDQFEDVWRENRPFLVDLAFRMLGNIADAEDVVQDAFSRLLRADIDEIEDVRGWCVVVVSRLCLDILRSAHNRRESPTSTPEPAPIPDPSDRVTLDDSVRMALYVMLEKLSPAERAVFVLHDVFRYPFETVASIVGRTPDSCRKLASRARRRVETDDGAARFAVEDDAHRLVADRFIAACAGGDLQALMELLHADVGGEVEMGPGGMVVPARVGRNNVARNLLIFFAGATGITLVSHSLGVLAFRDGHLYAIVTLETEDGLIKDIHAIRSEQTIAAIDEMLGTRAGNL
jgi:RNA polymerase sigma-70 factor (ECF subfamily)